MKKQKLGFGEIVKLRREKLGLSQMDVGEAVGLKSGVSCSDWERGDGMPESKRLQPLAQKLGLTVGQLFGEVDIPVDFLFKNAAHAEAAGYIWGEPIKPPAPQPFEPTGQEPGRFLIRVNLEDCELLSAFNQFDSRSRRQVLDYVNGLLGGSSASSQQGE
jgi:transcriptional regulator with XRE-family HTH domain